MLKTGANCNALFPKTFFEYCSGDTELFRICRLSFNEQFAAMKASHIFWHFWLKWSLLQWSLQDWWWSYDGQEQGDNLGNSVLCGKSGEKSADIRGMGSVYSRRTCEDWSEGGLWLKLLDCQNLFQHTFGTHAWTCTPEKKHTVVGDWRITEGVCDTGVCWKQLGDTVNFKTCGGWTFPEW